MDLSYPIGRFSFPDTTTAEQREGWIADIAAAPANLRAAVANLTAEQLDTPYRPGGWTIRQVVHHVPDSHIHAYVRFKLALTENEPTIKPYDEALWANLADTQSTPIEVSLNLLESLHDRWVRLLRSFSESDFERYLLHPEIGRVRLDRYTASYAWHCKHHVAHINSLRERLGWR